MADRRDEPHLETDFVSIEKGGAHLEILGKAHRHIEMNGHMEAFIQAILEGESIEAAVERFTRDLA